MRFTTREDIEVPQGQVFDALSDFDAFERMALRRGAEVRRLGPRSWDIRFRLRGKERHLTTQVERHEPPGLIESTGRSGGIDSRLRLDLIPLSPRRTRLVVDLDLTPTTLGARLLLQSLRLAKGRLLEPFKRGVAAFARDLEARHRGPGFF